MGFKENLGILFSKEGFQRGAQGVKEEASDFLNNVKKFTGGEIERGGDKINEGVEKFKQGEPFEGAAKIVTGGIIAGLAPLEAIPLTIAEPVIKDTASFVGSSVSNKIKKDYGDVKGQEILDNMKVQFSNDVSEAVEKYKELPSGAQSGLELGAAGLGLFFALEGGSIINKTGKEIAKTSEEIFTNSLKTIKNTPAPMQPIIFGEVLKKSKAMNFANDIADIKRTKGLNLEALGDTTEEAVTSAFNLKDKSVVSITELDDLAKQSKITPEDFQELGYLYETNPASFITNPELVRVGRMLEQKNIESLAIANEALKLNPGDAKSLASINQLHVEKLQLLRGNKAVRSSAGRALNAARGDAQSGLFSPNKRVNQAAEKVINSLDEENALFLSKELAKIEGQPEAQLFLLNKFAEKKAWDKMIEYSINSMLSGPKTQLRNMLGNMTNLVSYVLRTPIEAGVDALSSRLTGAPRTSFFSEVAPAFTTLPGSVKGAFQQGRLEFNLLKSGKGDLIPKVKQSEFNTKPQLGQDVDSNKLAQAAGIGMRTPLNIMAITDNFFRRVADDIVSGRMKVKTKEGLKLSSPEKRIQEEIDTLLFQKDLPPGLKGVQNLINSDTILGKFLKLKFPFFKTPMNIYIEGLKTSPAGLVSQGVKSATGATIRTAKNVTSRLKGVTPDKRVITAVEQMEFVENTSKAILGTAFTIPMISYALGTNEFGMPNITGAPPASKKERDLFFLEGQKPNSIFAFGAYRTYKDFGVFGMPLRMLAEMGDTFRRTGELDEKLALPMIAAIAEELTEKGNLKTVGEITDMVQGVSQGDGDFGQDITDFATGTVVSLSIPQILQGIARGTDPFIRDSSTPIKGFEDIPKAIINKYKAALPVFSQDLPAKIDVLGDPVERKSGVFDQMFNILGTSVPEPNVYVDFFNELKWQPPTQSKVIGGIKLTPQALEVFASYNGKTRAKMWKDTIISEKYVVANDKERVKLLEKATRAADEYAKEYFLISNSPMFADSVTAKTSNEKAAIRRLLKISVITEDMSDGQITAFIEKEFELLRENLLGY